MRNRPLPSRQELPKAQLRAPVPSPVRVLLVDHDPLVLGQLARGLRDAGYDVTEASDIPAALECIAQVPPDLALLAFGLDDADDELAHRLSFDHAVPFIFLAAGGKRELITRARDLGAVGCLVKPLTVAQIIPEIEVGLARGRELDALKHKEGQLERALEGGRDTSVATGILMERLGMNREQAFETLRSYARNQRRRLHEVAAELVDAAEVMNKLTASH